MLIVKKTSMVLRFYSLRKSTLVSCGMAAAEGDVNMPFDLITLICVLRNPATGWMISPLSFYMVSNLNVVVAEDHAEQVWCDIPYQNPRFLDLHVHLLSNIYLHISKMFSTWMPLFF